MPVAPKVTPAFRAGMAAMSPVVRGWGRLEVSGVEHLPSSGPTLLAGNHDSWWDPIVIGTAALERRQIQALTKSSLWKNAVLARGRDGMGQIPIDRGKGDVGALERAISELRAGACIGIFLEGTRSGGRPLRARSGFGRIAQAVPEAQIVCCAARRDGSGLHRAPPGRDPGGGARGRVRTTTQPAARLGARATQLAATP